MNECYEWLFIVLVLNDTWYLEPQIFIALVYFNECKEQQQASTGREVDFLRLAIQQAFDHRVDVTALLLCANRWLNRAKIL